MRFPQRRRCRAYVTGNFMALEKVPLLRLGEARGTGSGDHPQSPHAKLNFLAGTRVTVRSYFIMT